MKLRTELKLQPSDWRIRHEDGLIFLGSCFASEMGARLRKLHFPIAVNPYGITYHPIPLLQAALLLLNFKEESAREQLVASTFREENSTGSFFFHSEMNRKSDTEFMENIARVAETFRQAFQKANYLVLTMGTAIAHVHTKLKSTVANCHRFPKNTFQEQLTPFHQLQNQVQQQLLQLRAQNPTLRILLTVSPIRHIRSGIVENSSSKASLRTLCHQLSSSHPDVRYFPSYEIMLDDLRDYRFYKRDLIHPNELAMDYIWEQFGEVYFEAATKATNLELEQLHRDLSHRPRDKESRAYNNFRNKIKEKITAMESRFDMRMEREMYNKM